MGVDILLQRSVRICVLVEVIHKRIIPQALPGKAVPQQGDALCAGRRCRCAPERKTQRAYASWHNPRRSLRRILHVSVPNGVENGLFQITKAALFSIVALLGTSQIAANGVAQSFWSLAALFAIWMNLGVIGIAFAMVADWAVKAVLIWTRYRGGKWKTFQVI